MTRSSLTNNVPWEMLGLLLAIVILIVSAYFIGRSALAMFRKCRPIKADQGDDLRLIKEEDKDSFLLTYLAGWVILVPLAWFTYEALVRFSWLERL